MHSEDINDFGKKFAYFIEQYKEAIDACDLGVVLDNALSDVKKALDAAEEREAETREEDLNIMALELKADQDAGR